MYSTYEEDCEAEPNVSKKIMVLGGGPNRIGKGIKLKKAAFIIGMKGNGYCL